MSLIASSSTEVKFHSWLEGSLQHTYLPSYNSNGYIKTISWGRDGTWLGIVPSSGYAEILSIKDNVKHLLKIKDIHQPSCAVFPKTTKKCIALGTDSGQVLIYDIKCQSVKKRFPRVSSWIHSIDYNANDTHLASATSAGDVLVYNINTANLTTAYRVPNCNNITTLSFHRTKRNLLAVGTEEGVVAVWDINTNERKTSFQAHYAPVTDIALSPIRSDLIATVGKDRQFTFYDVQNKKSVVQVEVPSSMLALDFSHCGLYLGMGSQNGHVVIYDMRNLAKPINGFPAHEGKRITQIAFQRNIKQFEENSSILIQDKIDLSETAEENGLSPCSNIAFICNKQEMITAAENEFHDKEYRGDIEDSFITALGNVHNKTVSSPHHGSYYEHFSDQRDINNSALQTRSSEKKMSQIIESVKRTPALSFDKQMSSTPKYLNMEIPPTAESPILPSNPAMNLTDIKKVVSEVVQQEVNNLKSDIRHDFMESMAQMRRQFLDLQMFLVKEFINVENTVYKVSGVTVEEYLGDSQIIQENNRLRQEIEQLKEKIVEQDCTLNYS